MTGDKTAEPTALPTTDPTPAGVAPSPDPAPQPASSGWAPLLWILGGLLLVALPFGAVGILAVAVSGMFLGKEVMEAPGIPLMLGLFMVAGGTSVGARVWPALRWGGGAAAVGTLALVAFAVITGDRVDAYKDDGVKLTDGLALAWLVVIAIAAWGLRGRERWLGPLLAAVMLTSRLNVYPAFAIMAAFSKADGAIILVPIVATGIAAGALGVLLLGAIVAWFARALQRWVAPATVIGVLAVAALVVRIFV
ncbi:hypothetical protein [Reyranella sp. CPCC 100927]|uniref:hypothetical protein n=1 Tax=Reyranella sp. CPCC 100927 TaxID=2599616 RepID=UPI0011B47673|nr:hypothetical protein [Reyranella sp. CPCC 100927]TWT01261.1 hypothetical protein FQU96_32800 [Reyranella sp. CPCC 100927]